MPKLRKGLVSLLVFLMVFANMNLVFGNSANAQSNNNNVTDLASKISQVQKHFEKVKTDKATTAKAQLKATDKVRVIVEVDGETPLEYATKQGVLYKDLSKTTKESLNKKVVSSQKVVKNAISSKGVSINYNHNYTTAFNGFSGEVQFGDIAKIEKISGVSNVYIANEYNKPEIEPNMRTSHQFIQSYQTWGDAKLKGEGMVVAVIDTGVDPSHRDFVLSEGTDEALTEGEVNAIVSEEGLKGKFYTEKVPYGYNYYDQNDTILDLGPGASMHGMHVAGTVAANGDVENGGIKGVAPEAQVLGLKVFSNDPNYPSTWSDVYLAAIDDAIALGADVLNMSLGSTASFYDEESPEDLAITRAVENGIVCSISAGNSGTIGYGWDNPYYQNPDIGVVGAPGLNPDSISVAASGNVGYLYQHKLTVEGTAFEATGYGMDDWTKINELGLEVVSLSALNGVTEKAGISCEVCGSTADYEGLDVTGKIVLVKRGDLAFIDKTVNAAIAGAAGIVVYDHGLSQFYEDQGGWDIPFTMLHAEDGDELEALLADGTSKILNVVKTSSEESPEMGRMTDFTSWGTTPSLELKPEITAPGGNIYSTLNNDQYGLMSGTSMAAPHVAGGSALVQQYLQTDDRFVDLTAEERTRLAKVLLMNTADVIMDLNGQPFSPRRQGAGMMQLFNTVRTPVYVVNSDTNEGKVELKDFTSKKFDMTFTATNISDKDATYTVNSSVLADTLQQTASELEYNALIAGDVVGEKVDAPESVTVPAGESVDFTVSVDLTDAKLPALDKDGNAVTVDLREDIFVEGYVSLSNDKEVLPTLSVPYVGFYGEWDRPSVVDGFADLGETAFYDLSFAGFNNMLFGEDGYFVGPVADKGFYPVSPNGDGVYDDIYPLPAFLRNATEMQFNILDENKNLLRQVRTEHDVRKTFYDAGNGSYYDFNPARSWDGTVNSEVVEDGIYYYEIKSLIDYEGAEWQSKQIPVYVDTTAPTVNPEFNAETSTLTFNGTDSGVGVAGYYVWVDGILVNTTGTYGPVPYPASTKTLVLEAANENSVIEVLAADYAENYGRDVIAVNDTEKPIIYAKTGVTIPWGAYNTNEVPVEGYVMDNVGIETVTVNGEEAEVVFGTYTDDYNEDGKAETFEAYHFTATAAFEEDGKYDVIVTAKDYNGNDYSLARKVFIDTTAPKLSFDAPTFVNHDVEEITVNFNLVDNYKYLSLTINDNHVYELPFKTPVDIVEPVTETVQQTLSLKPGNNTFVVTLEDLAGNTVEKSFDVYRNEADSRVERLAGHSRYETSVEVSKSGWEKSDVVVLARGDNYADALAGIPLAKQFNAPLLLTETTHLTPATKAEIERLGTKTVYILGGKGAVSTNVEAELKKLGLTVNRLAGENRYDTAAKIAHEVAPWGAYEVVVVNGSNFPDALSVASYAASKGLPILLASENTVPKETTEALYKLESQKTLAIGGTGVLSDSVLAQLPKAYRVAGKSRYETSVEVAKYFDVDTNHYFVATGKSYADALSGAALAAKNGTGILLVGDSLSTATSKFISNSGSEKFTVIGGTGVVSNDVIKSIDNLFK